MSNIFKEEEDDTNNPSPNLVLKGLLTNFARLEIPLKTYIELS
jgi:hypothetical protein